MRESPAANMKHIVKIVEKRPRSEMVSTRWQIKLAGPALLNLLSKLCVYQKYRERPASSSASPKYRHCSAPYKYLSGKCSSPPLARHAYKHINCVICNEAHMLHLEESVIGRMSHEALNSSLGDEIRRDFKRIRIRAWPYKMQSAKLKRPPYR